MNGHKKFYHNLTFKIFTFGLIVNSIAVLILFFIIDKPNITKAYIVSSISLLLTIHYLALNTKGLIIKQRIYIAALILGFLFWISIKFIGLEVNKTNTLIEIITPIFLFLLIYLSPKR